MLSDKVVASIAPLPGDRVRVPDHEVDGLAIVVYPTGTKMWAWERWGIPAGGSKPRSLKAVLGEFPAMTTAAARDVAALYNVDLDAGLDPRIEAAKREAAAAELHAAELRQAEIQRLGLRSVEQLFDRFLLRPDVSGAWLKEQARIFKVLIAPAWATRDVRSITKRDCVAIAQPVVDRGKKVQANRLAAVVGKFLSWCVEQGEIEVSPVRGSWRPGGRERNRSGQTMCSPSRALADDEIARVWAAFGEIGNSYGAALKLALLTGMRRGEIAKARWADIENGVLVLHETKQRTEHKVPVGPMAAALIESMPRMDAFIFSRGNASPLRRWDRATSEARRLSGVKFKPHDLRHTTRSALSAVASPDVAERALGHALGGMRRVYDHHDYTPAIADALAKWEEQLLEIIGDRRDG